MADTSFVRVRITGVEPMIDTLRNLATVFEAGDVMRTVLRRAAVPIRDGYRSRALAHDATGNLAASTTIKTKRYPSGTVVAVAGPRHTGSAGATAAAPSGNHSWLVEFGSKGRRSPQNRGKRKTYVNVHKHINTRMTLHKKNVDSKKFEKMGSGYYFLMSSWKSPTRQARAGKGYTHDFLPADSKGRPRPYTLKAGATYGEMPPLNLMRDTISSVGSTSESIIRDGIVNAINSRLAARLSSP
jgi:hypothetical protein